MKQVWLSEQQVVGFLKQFQLACSPQICITHMAVGASGPSVVIQVRGHARHALRKWR